MENSIAVGNGFVRLDDALADDISVVNSARVSFGRSVDKMGPADAALINFLMRERHGTPFEHNAFRFHIKCPIFVAREWFRHRIGSFNEFSARYTEVPDDFFVPDAADVRTQVGKPGAYRFEPVDPDVAAETLDVIESVNTLAYSSYKMLLDMGVAKELARTVLPVSMFTQFYWTVNARALMNFLALRTHETAQRDIRQYADAVEWFLEATMPETYQAWNINGRLAP